MSKKPVSEFRSVDEVKYKALFENSFDAVLLTSPDGAIHAANPAACRMLGRTESEICSIGRNGVMDITDPRLEKALKKREKDGNFLGELTMIRKNGDKFTVELSTVIFSDKDGQRLTSMIMRDITERKNNELNLKTSEITYRSLFENSLIAISQAYPDGRFIRVNKAYSELYGYPDPVTMLEEISGNSRVLYSNADDRQKVINILDKYGFMGPSEFELNKRNGEKFWALVAAKQVKDDKGRLLFLQAEHIDITPLKNLEKQRYLSSQYARNLIEASLDPLVTINIDGKVTDVNAATEKITGIKRELLIGTDFAEYFSKPEKAREGYKIVFKNGSVKDYPLSILHVSGKKIDVLYNATLFKNDIGEVQGVFAAARDIAQQKKMEKELKLSARLLKKLNQHLVNIRENERNEIALNLHDDLGQRLTALYIDVAWLKSRIGVQSHPVQKKLEDMGVEINDTIESLKEISSFLRPTILYDLGLVPAIISQLNKFEAQSGIKCYFHYDSEEFKVEDRLALIFYRIIQESLTNIARHSGATFMDLNLRKLKDVILLVIKDNGVGIDKDKVNSLSSMGIAGIIERVKSASGEVSIKGKNGFGTTIRVTIPIKKRKK
jgi:PAS domain S-box-containing protein